MKNGIMTQEMLVGLEVIDDLVYQQYREAMTPILLEYGGEFGYDFTISNVLKTQTSDRINRLFTIRFMDAKSRDAFFSNPQYLLIKQQFFSASVASTTIISDYKI